MIDQETLSKQPDPTPQEQIPPEKKPQPPPSNPLKVTFANPRLTIKPNKNKKKMKICREKENHKKTKTMKTKKTQKPNWKPTIRKTERKKQKNRWKLSHSWPEISKIGKN